MSRNRWAKVASVSIGLVVASAMTLIAPSATSAERQQRPNINIQNNAQFDAAHGVRSGTGTMEHPYVISGWNLTNLRIENTSRHVLIRDNVVTGQAVLNWIGAGVHVHDNQINDLRVNQNVRRTGAPSSGEIAHNSFATVGQLRHWDGLFEHNVVGNRDRLRARAVNFDGFNGARFRNNTIYGYMDARLHGHHHSSAFGQSSHMHAGAHNGMVDHTHRYHQVFISANRITTTSTYALIYLDTNHAANDRTAPSEQEQELNKPHIHYTRVYITGNRLAGAGVLVNVFNANDNHHIRTARGRFVIRDNLITLGNDDFLSFRDLFGIEARDARDIDLQIEGNRIIGRPDNADRFARFDQNDRNAGIFLRRFDVGRVWVQDNVVSNRAIGVRAEQFTDTVRLMVRDLETHNVDQSVATDKTVRTSA